MNTTVNIHWDENPVKTNVVLHTTGDVWLDVGNVTFFPCQNFGDDPKLALDVLRNIGLRIVEQVNELNRELNREEDLEF